MVFLHSRTEPQYPGTAAHLPPGSTRLDILHAWTRPRGCGTDVPGEVHDYIDEAMAGDYKHHLRVTERTVTVL